MGADRPIFDSRFDGRWRDIGAGGTLFEPVIDAVIERATPPTREGEKNTSSRRCARSHPAARSRGAVIMTRAKAVESMTCRFEAWIFK